MTLREWHENVSRCYEAWKLDPSNEGLARDLDDALHEPATALPYDPEYAKRCPPAEVTEPRYDPEDFSADLKASQDARDAIDDELDRRGPRGGHGRWTAYRR
jgi:hypothetical protein